MKNRIGIARMLDLVALGNCIVEHDVELHVQEGTDFLVHCFDGYAIASNGINDYELSYPLLEDLNAEQKSNIIRYRYANMAPKDYEINYGDIMMACGNAINLEVNQS